eukprot:3711175-Prymnesium_polylepis.1
MVVPLDVSRTITAAAPVGIKLDDWLLHVGKFFLCDGCTIHCGRAGSGYALHVHFVPLDMVAKQVEQIGKYFPAWPMVSMQDWPRMAEEFRKVKS